MTIKMSDTVKDARNDAIETAISTTPMLRIFSGSPPATPATADSGTKCLEVALPSDFMGASSGGVKAKAGTWSGTGHANAGAGTNAGHFRIYNAAGTVCHIQGTITATSGGGDMELDNINIATGQTVTISTFTLTDGN
jgi:hypothetical protein